MAIDNLYLKSLILDESIRINVPQDSNEYKNYMNRRNSSNIHIQLRGKTDATHGSTVSNHSISIKIFSPHDTNGLPIQIATVSYLSLNKKDSELKSLNDFMELKHIRKKTRNFIKSFICNFQMLIVAIWYTDKLSDDKFKNAVINYIYSHSDNYYITPAQFKTDAQLEDDKKALIEYFKKELNDPEFKLKFGK